MLAFLKNLFSGREKHSSPEAYLPDEPISPNIDKNIEKISTLYGKSSDLVLRRINTGVDGSIPLLIVHIEGLVNVQRISDNILSPISIWGQSIKDPYEIYSEMYTRFLQCGGISEW